MCFFLSLCDTKFHLASIQQDKLPESIPPYPFQTPEFSLGSTPGPNFFCGISGCRADAEAVRGRLVCAAGRRDERPRVHGVRDPHHPPHGVKCLGRAGPPGNPAAAPGDPRESTEALRNPWGSHGNSWKSWGIRGDPLGSVEIC